MVARKKVEAEKQITPPSYPSSSPVKMEPVVEKNTPNEPQLVQHDVPGKSMSLSQMTHIAPKKFKPQKTKPNVDLAGVRALIDETRKEE